MRDPRAKTLAAAVTLEECLAGLPDWRPGRLEGRAIVHGHCHQKALVGMEPTRVVLSRVEGLEFEVLDSGCCGMAGSFGYEEGTTRCRGRAGSGCRSRGARGGGGGFVVAPGFPCRHQIAGFCGGRGSVSVAEVLAMAEDGR